MDNTRIYKNQADLGLGLTADFEITHFNPAASMYFNWEKEEVLGKNFFDLVSQTHVAPVFTPALFEELTENHSSCQIIQAPQESAHEELHWSIHYLDHSLPHLRQYIVSGKFLSVNTSKAVLDTLANLESVIACMPGSVYWKDRQGVYLGCNDKFVEMLGLQSRHEVIGKTDFDLAPLAYGFEIARSFRKVDQEIMASGQARLAFEEPPFTLADGSMIYQLDNKVPLRDGAGNIIGIVGIGIDITERKQIENQLKEAKERIETTLQEKTQLLEEMSKEARNAFANLQSIVACMPGSIFWKDRNGAYRGCNDRTVEMTGFKFREELIGKTDDDLGALLGWAPECIEDFKKIDAEVLATGCSIINHESMPMRLADGSTITQLTNKVPLRDGEGLIIGILGISIDISDRKLMEEELELARQRAESANKAKSHFLCIVSHELRTPLTGILGMAQLLNSNNVEFAERKEYIQAILKAGAYLLSLINNILDFTRLEEGKFELSPSPIDFKMLIEEVSLMLSAQAKARGIELLISYEPGVPNKIIADSRALRQIIINLVGNALKFTKVGHILTKVRCLEHLNDMVKLEISITDTGIGMPKDKLKTIFEHFQQLDSPYTRSTEGSGLGLSITRNLVELMDGEIGVTSEEGKGSTFYCIIDFPIQGEAITELPWSTYEGNVRTLVIDDTARAEVIRKLISTSNCQTAAGFEALNTLISAQTLGDPYKIVIIDQQLKSADPYELLQAINNRRKLQKPMPLLLASSGTLKAKKNAFTAGFFEVIVKPVRPIELQTALTSAWEKWAEKYCPPISSSTPKVLLVEDNKVIQIIHKNFLENLGCVVKVAENAEQTYAETANTKFDLILMDIGLPGVSGPAITERLRQLEIEKELERTPIIALTGYDDPSHKDICYQAGMDEVVIKPIQQENLKTLLGRWVKNNNTYWATQQAGNDRHLVE